MPVGPIQLLVLGFDQPDFRGEVLAEPATRIEPRKTESMGRGRDWHRGHDDQLRHPRAGELVEGRVAR